MSTANPSYKPSEGKREEFRKYLEKNGVMDALTRVLVNLYEEVDKPEDALEYIRDKLAVIAGLETYKQLVAKLADAEDRIKELESQVQVDSKPEIAEGDEQITDDQPLKTEETELPQEEGNIEGAPDAEQ